MRRAALVLVLLALVGFEGLLTGFSLYYRLAYILGLALVAGFAWSWLSLRWLTIEKKRYTTHTEVGRPIEGRMYVHNHAWIGKPWLEVQEITDLPGYVSGRALGTGARSTATWRVETPALRRGIFTIGPVRVIAGDPFGFFRLHRDFLHPEQVVIYPAMQPLPSFNLPWAGLPGDGPMRRHTAQTTPLIDTVRDYAPGDSLNRIHWATTARIGKLMVKDFDLGSSETVILALDLDRRVHVGEYPDNTEETAVAIAASVARKYLEQELAVGIAASGVASGPVPPDRGTRQLQRALEFLAAAKAEGRVPLHELLQGIAPGLGRYHTVLAVTPSVDSRWISALSDLKHRGVRVAAILLDAGSFSPGDHTNFEAALRILAQQGVHAYAVRRGDLLDTALRTPVVTSTVRGPLDREAAASG